MSTSRNTLKIKLCATGSAHYCGQNRDLHIEQETLPFPTRHGSTGHEFCTGCHTVLGSCGMHHQGRSPGSQMCVIGANQCKTEGNPTRNRKAKQKCSQEVMHTTCPGFWSRHTHADTDRAHCRMKRCRGNCGFNYFALPAHGIGRDQQSGCGEHRD
jgi:hypothetical protein